MSKTDFRLNLDASIMVSAGMPRMMQVLKRIQFFYCTPKTTAGTCPAVCSKCRAHLTEVITNIDPDKAGSPYAVLVWRLRNSAAKDGETHSGKTEISRNVFGERSDIDPLDVMLDEL